MLKLASVPQSRCPARIALAEAIAERDRIADVHADRNRRAEILPDALWERYDNLEARLKAATSPARGQFAAYERAAKILAGEEPDDTDPADALRAELAVVEAEIVADRKRRDALREDVHALANSLMSATSRVRDAAAAVMAAEGGRAALIAEHDRLAARAAILARAIDGAASPWIQGEPKPHHDLNVAPVTALASAPCPWAAAAERLKSDPDAPLPTIEAALAAIGSESSARDAA